MTLGFDTSIPGKVGIKFVIMDSGISVSTATVKRDVDEYISKLRDSDDLGDMLARQQTSPIAGKDKEDVVRNLENAREELEEKNPDPGLVEKYLGKAKSVFQTAAVGAELIEKAKIVFELFGMAL